MEFNSFSFLFFFPAVVLLNFIIPSKFRYLFLLAASYFFYMSWDPSYAVLMLTSTLITYLSGLLISHEKEANWSNRVILSLSLVSNLSILFFFKYFNFAADSLNAIDIGFTVNYIDLLLPVGISFYTFQALSYSMDVYRGEIRAEKNFFRYALYVSFFPQLVAGPIEKATHLLPQLKKLTRFNYENMRSGLTLMLWGLIKKVVIADRLALLVNVVYDDPTAHSGLTLLLATIFFAFQIYCDFSAYSDMAIGAARILGYDLMQNFNRPYFSKSISEFWRRWHISLGKWFMQYLYIPLGGNRKSRYRTLVNLLVVFVISGVWHGASMNFIIWGALHGIFIIIENLTKKSRYSFFNLIKIKKGDLSYKILSVFVTFGLVNVGWIFFRSNNLSDALYICKSIFDFNPEILFNGSLYEIGIDKAEINFSFLIIFLLLLTQYISRSKHILNQIGELWIGLRWPIYISLIILVVVFGVYAEYDKTTFIYFQF